MSKIRIYELAKELGVDNKVVIDRAVELGVPGKLSHSNTLDSDQADSIRRAVLRQAVGSPRNSEVVKTMLDKTTGAAQAVVERRQGNVIRRRRTTDAPEAPPATSASAGVAEELDLSTAGVLEASGSPMHRSDPLAEAEALFKTPSSPASIQEVVAEPVEIEQPTEAAAELEAAEVLADEGLDVEVEAEPVVQQKGVAAPPDAKPAIGPKILGRIDLPQQKRIVRSAVDLKAEPRKGTSPRTPSRDGSAAVAMIPVEDDGDGWGKKGATANKKGRKREIMGSDLLDYRGREGGRRPRSRDGRDRDDRKSQNLELTKMKASKRVVKIGDSITVGELAKQMSLKAGEVIAKLLQMGMMATINQAIDKDTAEIIAGEFEYQIESVSFDETDIIQDVVEEEAGNLRPRPPVVTVMGHVDHGKTSLLDRIRSTSVAAKEHGGITQHIGAYQVKAPDGREITFIDTPGHAAFTSMRARGAQVTDIVVLVVAADDGVMPQTKEAISHAQAAKVPIVVAINKIDKPDGNPDRIKTQLAEFGLQPEDWGGDTMFFQVSALRGDGIPELLDGILLLGEVRELQANPDRRAKGTVIESRQERGRGVVATVLVQSGTLRRGEIFVSGATSGRVRTMDDCNGERLAEAGPSTPVEITGFSEMPQAGDDFFVVESEAGARDVAQNRSNKKAAEERALASGPISLEEFSKRAGSVPILDLNVILKADVQGSVEAVHQAMEKLSGDKVRVRVLHAAVGGVSESDVQLAVASKAIIVGFGVRSEPRAQADAERLGVEIRFYRVIYELLDDLRQAMVGLLDPIRQESSLGRVDVREVFSIPKFGVIAGCYVTGGVVKRGSFVRLLRDNRVIYEGRMASLRRFKDDVKEVQAGFECGISIDGYNDVKVGDVIEVFEYKEIAPTLD